MSELYIHNDQHSDSDGKSHRWLHTFPMVGRDDELQQLLQHTYTLIEQPTPQFALITGDPGIGKSRLMDEFCHWLTQLPETIAYIRVQVDPLLQNQPYALWRNVFLTLFHITNQDSPTSMRSKFEQGVTAILQTESNEKPPFIGQLLGFDFFTDSHLQTLSDDTQQVYTRGIHYIAQCVAKLTQQTPWVFCFEDLHWADNSSLQLLQYLLKESKQTSSPLMVVGTMRDQTSERYQTSIEMADTHISLAPLSDEYSLQLIKTRLQQVAQVPDAIQSFLVQRSTGNPFYIEELIKMLVTNQVLQFDHNGHNVTATSLANLQIPNTLTDILRVRLEYLSQSEQTILEYAALAGQMFWYEAIVHLHQSSSAANQSSSAPFVYDDSIDVDQVLTSLEHQQLIVPQTRSSVEDSKEYHFKHEMLYDVVYQRLTDEQRHFGHAQIATWLTKLSKERADEYAVVIAEHHKRAAQQIEAAEWYTRAGQRARDSFAAISATKYFEHALTLLPATSQYTQQRMHLYESVGETLRWQTTHAKALHAFTKMRNLAASINDIAAQSRAWRGMAAIQNNQGDAENARQSAEQAEQIANSLGPSEELAQALAIKSSSLIYLGQNELALATAQRVLDISRQIVHRRTETTALNLIGTLYASTGDYISATTYVEQALTIHREQGNRQSEAIFLNNLACFANGWGDFTRAEQLAQEALVISQDIGTRFITLHVLSALGEAQIGLARFSEAEAILRQGISLLTIADQSSIPELYYLLAKALLGQHKNDDLLYAQQALELVQPMKRPRELGIAWRVLGEVIGQSPDFVGATACFAESLRILTEAKLDVERAHTLREWARFELTCGDANEGLEHWNAALTLFEKLGLELEVARMKELPGQNSAGDGARTT